MKTKWMNEFADLASRVLRAACTCLSVQWRDVRGAVAPVLPVLWVLCGATFCPAAIEAPADTVYPRALLKHRVEPNGTEHLCTPIARYKDAAGRTVDLVGAVHLGSARYYRDLNRAFARYDKVLYEMVDGEGMPEMLRLARKVGQGKATPEEEKRFKAAVATQADASGKGSGVTSMLGRYYVLMAQATDLSLQMEMIDYSLENMVFADMSSTEFSRAMADRGESWMGLIVRSLGEGGSAGVNPFAPGSSSLKASLIRALLAESSGSSLESSAVIISRNERCFEVLDRVLASSPERSRIAIFYGAMHLRDMHRRLQKRGFTLHGVQWITAI